MSDDTQEQPQQAAAVDPTPMPAGGPETAVDPTAGTAHTVTTEQAQGLNTALPEGTTPVQAAASLVPGVQADGTAVISPEAHAEVAEHMTLLRSLAERGKNDWNAVKEELGAAITKLEKLLHLEEVDAEQPDNPPQ